MVENFRLGFGPIRVFEPPRTSFCAGFKSFCQDLVLTREEVYCWGWTLLGRRVLGHCRAYRYHTSVLECASRPVPAACLFASLRRTVDLMSAQEAGADDGGHSKATKGHGMTLYRFKVALDQILHTFRRMLGGR